ncbi:ATP-binding cassette domain-containing protein [Ornithinimicrobium faecis]|uniref:ATP-binding cassette domain-containing protein n=1 Tax=Ornithinimicrobium faecis TaxID=2934158 RepID=A0ABY4YS81_9MICO|nr:ATP-binding cassette domain-containing protein [Ornithinimicrobium sp. HY1793]USQ79145.1 ATP-binding cassette domain-containing protein [Ornithinimicrobium sp. HY1793]
MTSSVTEDLRPTGPRVEMQDIRKRYGVMDVLRGVNLQVAAGEVIGLVGDNGAGKSTLMKMLAGAVTPDSGTIRVDGTELTGAGPRESREHGIEMVYQDLALCNDLDVAANLFLGRELHSKWTRRLDHQRMHEEAAQDLKTLHIRISDTYQEVGNLSGGQRQAVAIARAVTFHPKVLVLDEPTAALAAKEVEMVLQLIRDVSARGVSVVLITHRLQDLFEVCDRLVVLHEGVMHRELEPSETDLTELVAAMMGK